MPAKRSLRLEAAESIKNEKSKVNVGHDPGSYSPLTGTRQMSPSSASKRQAEARARRRQYDANIEAAELETSSRGQTTPGENAEILELFSKVEESLNEFLQMRQHLANLQAVEGSRELGNLFGMDSGTLDLKTEMQKTKVLIGEVRKKKKQKSTA